MEENTSIWISVVMATYNSENTIEKSLDSICRQSIGRDHIEILIVDGHSSDKTRLIAERFGTIILDNPYRLPELAKRIGVKYARGRYVQIMDSDEVLEDDGIFKRRIEFMDNYPEVMTIMAGYESPQNHSPCGKYMSYIGDPFSAFIYRWYIDGNIGLIKKRDFLHNNEGYIGSFSSDELLPISDSLTTIRASHLREKYGELIESENISTIVQKIVEDTHLMGHVSGDYVLHYTRSDLFTYLKKLKFRVINNVYDVNGSGYSARAVSNKKIFYRKYFFPLYSATILLPIFDGIRMSIYYRHCVFLLHPIFAWYVMVEIFIHYINKLCGKKKSNKSYGFD